MKKLLIIFLSALLWIPAVLAQGFSEGPGFVLDDVHFGFPRTVLTAGGYTLVFDYGSPFSATGGGYSLTIKEDLSPVCPDYTPGQAPTATPAPTLEPTAAPTEAPTGTPGPTTLPTSPPEPLATPTARPSPTTVPVPVSFSPATGTMDMSMTVTGAGFGNLPGSVYIGKWRTKIINWSDTLIELKIVHYLPAGSYPVKVEPAGGELITALASFTYLKPELNAPGALFAAPGGLVSLSGSWFGGSMAGFQIYFQSATVKWLKVKAEMQSWIMDPMTGAGTCLVRIPQAIEPGAYTILARNYVDWADAACDGIIIE